MRIVSGLPIAVVSAVATVMVLLSSVAAAQDRANSHQSIVAFVRVHCFTCHGDGATEGDVDLGKLEERLHSDAELVSKLIHVLHSHKMPPVDEPQPTAKQRKEALSHLRPVLHEAVLESRAYIRTPIRRLNRFQYNNAVVDLFDLNCIVFTLPERTVRIHHDYFRPETGKMADNVSVGNRPLGKSQLIEPRLAGVAAFPQDLRAEHGYDNRGDHLSLSPLLMDQFLKLGQSITQSPDFNSKRVGIWESFFAPPAEGVNVEGAIRDRLQPFLTKAFRRPPQPELVDRYVRFVAASRDSGGDFTAAMKSVAAATIASPRFLYLYDRKPRAAKEALPQPIEDFELAQRLAMFLWGSLPDETLLSLAKAGTLTEEETLNEQVDRLLRDRKLKRFCDTFPSQWLQLDRIVSSTPSREKFPAFYFSKYRASMHMMIEPLLLFETVLIEDLPITQLIDSDFTYRSAKLEEAYGPLASQGQTGRGGGVTVLNFRRVPVTDRRAGGVITNAAVMTMTSGVERTQPITRGAWIASVIFNDPPEPPPADVPPLSENPKVLDERLTLREQLAIHRERADCRGCHEQLDPLGFALENYDPVGKWRDQYEDGLPIDASGHLFREHAFVDVIEFKDAILADKERFCRALAGHLLSFALARQLGPADELTLDRITAAVAADGYKMKTLIRQIVLSDPFRTKS